MHQVQVHVVELELAEGLLSSRLNIMIVVVPELGSDVELFTGYACSDALSNSFSDLFFITIGFCGVDVTISIL